MRRLAGLALLAVVASASAAAAAGDARPSLASGHFLLALGGAPSWVRVVEDAPPALTVEAEELTAPELSAIDTLLDGTSTSRAFVLQGLSGKKAGSARLVGLRLPAVGASTRSATQLAFATENVTRSLFVLAGATSGAPGRRLASVRLELDGQPVPITGIDPLGLRAGAQAGAVSVTVDATGLEAFTRAKATPRTVTVDYLDDGRERVLALDLAGCRVRPFKPPTSRITLECASARRARDRR